MQAVAAAQTQDAGEAFPVHPGQGQVLLQIFDRVVRTAFSTGAGFSEKYMFSKMSEVPALPLMRSLLFQTIPPAPRSITAAVWSIGFDEITADCRKKSAHNMPDQMRARCPHLPRMSQIAF